MKNIYKNTFGLQISNEFLKAVELSNGKSSLRVKNYSLVPLPTGVVEDNCIVINKDAFREALQKLIINANNGPIISRNVIISIPEEKTFRHHLEIPVEYSENDDYIRKMAKDYIPIDFTEAIIDYKPIKRGDDKGTVVFDFVAVQKTLVQSLIDILEKMGLNVIGVGTSQNSLLRCCNNRFEKNEGAYMVSYMDVDKFLISVATPSGHSYSLDIPAEESRISEKAKNILKAKDLDELFEIVKKCKENIEPMDKEKQIIVNEELRGKLDIITKKARELIKAVKNQEGFELKNIYLLGRYSCMLGLQNEYRAIFPKAEIKTKLSYIDINGMAEMVFAEAIGLALRSALTEENEKNIDLLPIEKKDKIDVEKRTPEIKIYSILFSLGLIGLMVWSGIGTMSNYLTYKTTKQELAVYAEKVNNPYLTQIAKATQQKNQLEDQINTIAQNIIPLSVIFKKLDTFNIDGINLVGLDYALDKDNNPEIRLRAKVKDRDTTEIFVSELENIGYFTGVDSPLSNLIGKGERFVNIDLMLNPSKIIEAYGKTEVRGTPDSSGEDLSKPKMPN